MISILNNPYRIVGLLVGATAAEQRRQITRLQMFLAADQEPEGDFSFSTLGHILRTLESVNEAASKLNFDSDKMGAALFWFYKGNPITDEPALDAIKDANLNHAISIWTKLISNGEVTQRNASAFSNLGTLYLSGIIEATNGYEEIFEQGISLKLKFLESEYIKEFKALTTDATFKITNKELQLLFLNLVLSDIEKSGRVTSSNLLDILTRIDFSAKDDFFTGFIQKPIEQIERKVEEAKAMRKANSANAAIVGKNLYVQTSENLKLLKSILGSSNLRYSSISDRVSDEILQCGIDYFSHFKDSNTDPGSASMDLLRKSKTLAIGTIAKQRCQDNTENLQEWINDKPERDKQKRILVDFEKIKNIIDEYEGRSETVANAKLLLSSASQYLWNVRRILGSTDNLYLGLSSRIASDAQSMCAVEINKLQERLSKTYDGATKLAVIVLLKQRIDEACEVISTIGSMDLRQDFISQYSKNKNSLYNLKNQLSNINTGGRLGGSGGNSGCYIATMVYGDYGHPQVLILRQFRDEVLDKSVFGRLFIKIYYYYSPRLVIRLEHQEILKLIIRKVLNQFVKIIKK